MMKYWICIQAACGESVAEDLGAELAGSFGVSVELTPGGVRFYLEEERFSEDVGRDLERILEEFGKARSPESPIDYAVSRIEDEAWEDCWKQYFKPLRAGKRFLVCPTWETTESGPDDLVILLDPGRAFGTGHHETTRLCLEWLEEYADRFDARRAGLLDLGTGSGILAIAGALLGFWEILGVDNNPSAVEVAEENVSLNRLNRDGGIRFRVGTVSRLDERFDVIIANIQAHPLIEMAYDLASRLKPDGTIALSGILGEQTEEVRAAYEGQGLKLQNTKELGEWRLLEFK